MTLLAFLWAIAFGLCPQRPSHTLFFAGQQMPIEARMGGIFAGFLIGAAYFSARGRGRAMQTPGRIMTVALLGFIVLMGLDGVNAVLTDLRWPHLYPPTLPLRLATGLLTGLTLAAFLLPAFNSTVWRSGPALSPLTTAVDLWGGLGLLAIYFTAALSGIPLFFYPLSLLGVLGIPVILTLTATTILAMVLRRSNQASRWVELLPLLVLGSLATLGILTTLSGVRFILFGTGPMEMPVFLSIGVLPGM